jgi:hypothetical protein
LAYLSRYTHRVAISNRRLIAADKKSVTFTYRASPSHTKTTASKDQAATKP